MPESYSGENIASSTNSFGITERPNVEELN